jgi:GT2 family glycosyltransferase
MAFVGEAEAILILNPDLTVGPGAIAHLVARLSRAGTEGIVVPAIENPDGSIALSLRYEPTLSRRLGDAVFGSKWPTRPSALSETVRNRRLYLSPHRIEWATGAALLVSRTVSDRLGSWDERFFLYSEETDYFRRARDLGVQIWFEPAARVTHKEAGSGRSAQLVALTVVNAVRYIEKHQPRSAAAHRAILALHELRRWRDPEHRVARTILLDRAGWDSLPAATKGSRS